MIKYKYYILILILSINISIKAQDTITSKKTVRLEKKKIRKEKRIKKIAEGKTLFTPILVPAYSPELGALISGGGLVSFKTNKKDSLIQRSSFPFTISYTTTSAIVSSGILSSYWFKDKLRINVNIAYKDMPDNYWGVGYKNAYNNHLSDTTTAYNRNWWAFNPRFLYQIKKNYFIGLNIDYNYTKGSNDELSIVNDSIYKIYNEKPFNSGLGFIFRYDSRDYPIDAHSGFLFDFRTTFYSPKMGGDNKYRCFVLDYRQYMKLGSKPRILAWQLKTRITKGDVPYGEMSQLGTPYDIRGYRWGRYRNNDMFYAMVEYRHKFMKKTGIASKHSFVSWGAAGLIFNLSTAKEPENRWLPNAGVGYRFELQPRMYVRFDVGFGRKSYGFYINFNQVF